MKSESCHECQYLAKILADVDKGLEDLEGEERESFRHFHDHAKEAFVNHIFERHSDQLDGVFWPACPFCQEPFQNEYQLKDHLTNHPDLLQHIFHAAMNV